MPTICLQSIRNRHGDKLDREKEEEKDLSMRENKMGDWNRRLNSKLFAPNNYNTIQFIHPSLNVSLEKRLGCSQIFGGSV